MATEVPGKIPSDGIIKQKVSYSDRIKAIGDGTISVKIGENIDTVWRPWRTFVIIALIVCIIFLIYGATSVALYNKIPDGSTECKQVFDVATQNALLSTGSVGTVIFGIIYFRMYFLNK